MHCGRSRDHWLSRTKHRSQINRHLAHPQDEREDEPFWPDEDDVWDCFAEEDWERYNEEQIEWDEDEWYEDEYYETYDEHEEYREATGLYSDYELYESEDFEDPPRNNLTRPSSDWGF